MSTILSPGAFTAFSIRLKTRDTEAVTGQIEKVWRQFFPGKAFEYTHLNESLRDTYQQESRLMQLIGDFAAAAIVLACFGLFGLVDFTVRQRRKEIGIRKVLGATVAGITGLLARDFLKLVAVAFLIATPVAYYVMDQWLTDFAYRINMQWWIFLAAGLAAIVVAFLTVSVQSIRAALTNPVQSLKNE